MTKPFSHVTGSYAKINKKPGSNRLYIYLKHLGTPPYEVSTGLPDTDEHRRRVQKLVADINADISAGVFRFALAFPGAPTDVQAKFSRLEGRELKHSAASVTFKMGYASWRAEQFPALPNTSIKRDYTSAINAKIFPYFKDHRFDEITKTEVMKFFSKMTHSKSKEPKKVGRKRMQNVLYVLQKIWQFTNDHFGLKHDPPFAGINQYIIDITRGEEHEIDTSDPKTAEKVNALFNEQEKQKRKALDFSNYLAILDNYEHRRMRLATELMFLTGMSPSEVGGLVPKAVVGDHIKVKFVMIRGRLKTYPKTDHRVRNIPITRAIRLILDEAMSTSPGPFIFSAPEGGPFNERTHRSYWQKASRAAEVELLDPYSSRHSFVAYCEVMGIYKMRIVALMGHANKAMIDNVYGKYLKGVEKDAAAIKSYYGEDFWNP